MGMARAAKMVTAVTAAKMVTAVTAAKMVTAVTAAQMVTAVTAAQMVTAVTTATKEPLEMAVIPEAEKVIPRVTVILTPQEDLV
jgi:hypothetical protein